MKVVPQIITFLVILAIGWFAYERHDAFRVLVDDIVDYSRLTREVTREVADVDQPAEVLSTDKIESAQSLETVVATTDPVAEEIKTKPEQTVTRETVEKESAPVEEAVVWPDEVQPLAVEKQSTEPEDLAVSKNKGIKPEVQVPESTVKPVPRTDEGQVMIKKETWPSTEGSSPQQFVLEEPVAEVPPVNNNEVVVQPSAKDTKPGNEVNPAEAAPSTGSRKQQALAGLAAARTAWHQGDHDRSVNLYNQLIREFKNHPDFPGELGNIYFSKGQMELAVNAYSEAFLRLLRNNDFERAQQVLGIVYNIDQEQAALLREYLSQ